MKQELIHAETGEIIPTNPYFGMMRAAIENKMDMSGIEKMMDLADRHEKNEARKAYTAAMARFKAMPLNIVKNKHVSYGQGKTSYNHADLASIVDEVGAKLSECGLSASWRTAQENNQVCVTCVISHDLGHSEETTLCAAPDQSGGKNNIQAVGSTVTYLQRYTLMSITGAAAKELQIADNDAYRQIETITDEQANKIDAAAIDKGIKLETITNAYNINDIFCLPASKYEEVINRINKTGEQK